MPLNEKNPRLEQSDYDRFDHGYAMDLKEDYPQIWSAGGNERGNEAYEYWHKYTEGDRSDGVIDWVREREAWAARHFEDGKQFKENTSANLSNIGGVVAQIKWGVVGTLGERRMKAVIKEVKDKLKTEQSQQKFSSIPAKACVMTIGEFVAGDNGEGAKSAPVKLKARSGGAIEHWYWGNVVHDFAGMKIAKNRLAIDYVHDPKEIIGYLNKFETEEGDLYASGALVPYKDSDRASEIIHKMKEGVPYEASINFGGDGIKVEELAAGQVATINGNQFEGPATIIREWPLRGVAVCPYGADANTETAVFDNKKTFAASVVSAANSQTEESPMSDEAVEVSADIAEEQVKPEANLSEEVNAETVEAVAEDSASAEPVEAEPAAEEAVENKVEEPVEELNDVRVEFARMCKEFGSEIAAEVFANGGDYAAGMKLAFDRIKAENENLKAKIADSKGGSPAAFKAQDKKTKSFSDLFRK